MGPHIKDSNLYSPARKEKNAIRYLWFQHIREFRGGAGSGLFLILYEA